MTRSAPALVAATLAVVLLAPTAVAQPEAEFEIGGGYHKAIDIPDIVEFPSAVTVDARVTNWSGRWGVAARGLVSLGGVRRLHGGAREHRHLTHLQVLVRHRSVGPGGTGLHLGVGSGISWIQETFPESDGLQKFRFVPQLLALEALGSKTLTDRLSIRVGVAMVVLPLHVNPTVLLAWGF